MVKSLLSKMVNLVFWNCKNGLSYGIMKKLNSAGIRGPVIYVTFDLLYDNQVAVYDRPLHERRQLLTDNFRADDELIIASFIENKSQDYFKAISELGLEGVIAKKNCSVYLPGKHTKDWLKFKRKTTQDFVVCGYLINEEKSKQTFRSLIGIRKQRKCFWVKPLVVYELEYLELTDDGILGHPVFKRFRSDLKMGRLSN